MYLFTILKFAVKIQTNLLIYLQTALRSFIYTYTTSAYKNKSNIDDVLPCNRLWCYSVVN